jgi:hypothetical protein
MCELGWMAGGMNSGHLRNRLPAVLREGSSGRNATGKAAHPGAAWADNPAAAEAGSVGRPCWIVNGPDMPGRWPAMLLDWQKIDGAWWGRCIWGEIGTVGISVRDEWVPAGKLERVESRRGGDG